MAQWVDAGKSPREPPGEEIDREWEAVHLDEQREVERRETPEGAPVALGVGLKKLKVNGGRFAGLTMTRDQNLCAGVLSVAAHKAVLVTVSWLASMSGSTQAKESDALSSTSGF